MDKYEIRIGSEVGVYFGTFISKSKNELLEKVAEMIENLHPINSTEQGAELYRQRFRGKPVFARKQHEKDFILITKTE